MHVSRLPFRSRCPGFPVCLLLLSALSMGPWEGLLAQGAPQGEVTALVGGTLVDGFGADPIQNSVVVVEGNRIRAVGREGEVEIPTGARIVSTHGMTVLPGLWDMHVHLMLVGHSDYDHWFEAYPDLYESVIMPAAARQLLLAGVTSARDLGAPLEASIAVRDRLARGEIPGPTLYVSGPFLQHRPYPGNELFRWGISGVDDARDKVRQLAEAGVDVIKLVDQDLMEMEEVQALVEEAHRHGLPVVAHSHRPEEIRRGLEAGVDNFEHTGLATAPEYPADVMTMLRERTAQGARGVMGPLFWTPTIEGLFNYEYVRDHPLRVGGTEWHLGLPEEIVEDIRTSLQHLDRLPYFRMTPARRPTLGRKFQQLREAGVVLLVGTDSGIPAKFHNQSTWNELDIWVRELGVEPMEAIRSATYWPAFATGVLDEVGTVSEGKRADIIAVQGDVLRYISLLQRVDLVMKDGVLHKVDGRPTEPPMGAMPR
jgi:imidazolonepropionase-like amidohydrolase